MKEERSNLLRKSKRNEFFLLELVTNEIKNQVT